jgi:hypothetical protein
MFRKLLVVFALSMPLVSFSQPYLEQGLVAFWPFNGNANDYSGNGYNGSAVGVWSVNDHNGQANHAYFFDGIASKVGVAHDKFVTSYLTVSFFIRITESAVYNFAMACSDFIVYTEADSVGITISLPTPKSTRGYAELTKWTHVVGTYDNSDIRLYINGALVDSVYHPGIIYDMDWQMVMGGFGSNYWEGELDDIRIYDRVLSEIEVGQLYDYYGITEPEKVYTTSVWPQPSSGVVNFHITGEIPAVKVYSTDGRCVFEAVEPSMNGSDIATIDLSTLPDGIYMMELLSKGSRQTARLILSR